MIVIRRSLSPKRSAVTVVLYVIVGMGMAVTVRGDLRSYRGHRRVSCWAVRQADDERRDDQRKANRQRDHNARRMPGPAVAWRLAHALHPYRLPYPPQGDIHYV